MPGALAHFANVTMCMHGGQSTDVPSGPKVFVSGQPVATGVDQFTIVGCPFSTPAGPHPCVTITWLTPSLKLTSLGRAILLQTSTGMTQAADMAPQGAPLTSVNQPRVNGI